MLCFHKKKKKSNALMIVAIVVTAVAAAAGAYVLFTKVLKDKICKKKCADGAIECDCEEIADEACECTEGTESVEDTAVAEDSAETVEE